MITRGIFKANDIRGVVSGDDPQWDADGAYAVGAALADTLALGAGDALVLGHDMRLTSEELSAALSAGVRSRGADVINIGLASTDQLWFASGSLDRPGAMITASHNPGHYNGVKFCLPGAKPISPELLRQIADRALAFDESRTGNPLGRETHRDLLPAYAEHLHGLVDLTGLRRLRVVVDAGNGMAGHTLPAVLGHSAPKPVDIELVELYTDLDGSFPHHPPNPLEPENLVDAQAAVTEHRADLALVFDGDADRCFIIDERGEVITPSIVTALIATQELAREPGATIVCNAITSRTVPEVVTELGGQIVITKVGHTFVKAAMAEHQAIFGGEHSAHYYFRDFWGADTGMLAALHILALAGATDRPLSTVVAEFGRYVESGELNSTVADQTASAERLVQAFAGRGQVERLDGVTIRGDDWWVNVRPSNTEPLLRLNVEATTVEQMTALRDEALAVLRADSP